MNPRSPTALVISLIALILFLTQANFTLGLFGNILLLVAFLAAIYITIQRRAKTE